MPVEIKSLKITGNDGNNLQIEVEYQTNIDNNAALSLNVTDNIELLDKGRLILK
jgi:hypothetical protein